MDSDMAVHFTFELFKGLVMIGDCFLDCGE